MSVEVYRLIIAGHLGSEWSEWFDGLTVTMADNGETVLTGPVVDQTALHGVLLKIRELGLPLLSLTRVTPDMSDLSTGPMCTTQREHRE